MNTTQSDFYVKELESFGYVKGSIAEKQPFCYVNGTDCLFFHTDDGGWKFKYKDNKTYVWYIDKMKWGECDPNLSLADILVLYK